MYLMQQVDPTTKELIKLFNTSPLTPLERSMIQDCVLVEGLLCRKYKGKELLVVPKTIRIGIVIAVYDLAGHFSVERYQWISSLATIDLQPYVYMTAH